MQWVNEPMADVGPSCNNCFIYAHGGCPGKCPYQACSVRF